MSSEDRDKQFEEVLGRHVQRHWREDALENCPDANVLAAYHERALSPEEMSAWKEHIAACAACQELLTHLEETDDILVPEPNFDRATAPVFAEARGAMPAMAAPVQEYAAQSESPKLRSAPVSIASGKADGSAKPLASKKILRWVAPAGAIAAALLIYAMVRENRLAKLPSAASTEVAEYRKDAAAPPQQPAAREPERANSPSKTQTGDQLRAQQSAYENARGRQDKLLEEENTLQKHKAQLPGRFSDFARLSSGAAAPNAPNLLRQQKNETQRMAGAAAAAPQFTDSKIAPPVIAGTVQAPPPVPSVSAPTHAAAAPAEKDGVSAYTESKKDSARALSSTEALTVQTQSLRDSAVMAKTIFRHTFLVASPDSKSMWRVGSSGSLEFSSDRGASWLPQQTFTAGEFTAGFAPSAKVCWIVGTHGTILLTTDAGHTWKKVSSPLVENLGGVHATDAAHASIWDAANSHTFETSDGGVTWKQAVNE